MITTKHHGTVAGVIGSCHELTLEAPGDDREGVLVDWGLFQSGEAKGQTSADNPGLDFPIDTFALWWLPTCTWSTLAAFPTCSVRASAALSFAPSPLPARHAKRYA